MTSKNPRWWEIAFLVVFGALAVGALVNAVVDHWTRIPEIESRISALEAQHAAPAEEGR